MRVKLCFFYQDSAFPLNIISSQANSLFVWGARILSVAPNCHQLNRNKNKTITTKTKFFLSFHNSLIQVLESNLLGSDCAFFGSTLAPGPSGPHALREAMILQGILRYHHQKKGQWLMSGKSNKTMQVR